MKKMLSAVRVFSFRALLLWHLRSNPLRPASANWATAYTLCVSSKCERDIFDASSSQLRDLMETDSGRLPFSCSISPILPPHTRHLNLVWKTNCLHSHMHDFNGLLNIIKWHDLETVTLFWCKSGNRVQMADLYHSSLLIIIGKILKNLAKKLLDRVPIVSFAYNQICTCVVQ